MMPVMEVIMPHTSTGNVPAFLAKLWKMVDNPETDLLICWTEEGNSFIIRNQSEFSRDLLPYYYKHSNMASFIRQLNMYGFHKVMSVDSGGLKGERDEIEFAHPYFLRGQEHLLSEIKRKVTMGSKPAAPYIPNIKSDKVNEVLTEVSLLKDRQEDTDSKLETMRQENEALWQEVLNLRQKHSQQQKIVNKLIHFLMAVVQPRMTGIKRRFGQGPGAQLAIEDSPVSKPKEPKLETSKGPVIQDVTHSDPLISLLEGANNPSNVEQPVTPKSETGRDGLEKLKFDGKYRLVDPATVNSSLIQGRKNVVSTAATPVSTASPKRPALNREISKEDFDLDINNMQAELDNLKDILSGQITLDTSLVSSLFSPEDNPHLTPSSSLPPNLANMPASYSIPAEGLFNDDHDLDGNQQLVSYNPSLFELTAEDDQPEFMESLNTPPSAGNTADLPADLNTPLVSEDLTNPLSRI